jgi:hypothetical protein
VRGWSVSEWSFTWTNCRLFVEVGNRRYLAGVKLKTLMLELGHESLAVTQDYLAAVRKLAEKRQWWMRTSFRSRES